MAKTREYIPIISLTGRSFFINDRQDTDTIKCKLAVGDVVLYSMQIKRNNVTYNSGQIRGLIYDGKNLCHLHLLTFINNLGFKGKEAFYTVLENIKTSILLSKKRNVLYRNGYHLERLTCYRCGHCCIKDSVVIVKTEYFQIYSYDKHIQDMVILKNANIPCPYLYWDLHDKASCKIHDYKWFQYTPCSKHNWGGGSFQCNMWKQIEDIIKKKGRKWYLAYYQGYGMEEYRKKFYKINSTTAKEHIDSIRDQLRNLSNIE